LANKTEKIHEPRERVVKPVDQSKHKRESLKKEFDRIGLIKLLEEGVDEKGSFKGD
jgi:hypothetical protein